MRFLVAILGILVSIPPLIFFWIGSQTFVRGSERALAVAITLETAALLAFSIALFFTPSVLRIQVILLAVTIVTVAAVLGAHGLLK